MNIVNLPGEEWKLLDDYPGYMISNKGRFYSLKRQGAQEGLRKSYVDKRGREVITLRKDGKYVTKRVHRLLMETFTPNPESHPVVLHLDGDSSNNSLENLKWGTQSENILQSYHIDKTHNWATNPWWIHSGV